MGNQKETQIPVFTVWKNNAILKNIFLINAPPPVNQNETQQETDENCRTHQEFEETLVVGRHPDCDIRVEHPSISRFHFRIHSKPSSKHLSVTDLSSVHGTWVSGKRIEANVRTMMNESDSLRIGGSSRVYKLHWIPLSQAYDVSNPYVPPLDLAELQEEEEEEIIKDENSLGLENEEVQAVDSVLKGLESGGVCEDGQLVIEQVDLQTENNGLAVGNASVELEYLDLEGLVSLFLNEKSHVTQEDMPPDPPTQKMNSGKVVNESLQPLDSVLEGLVPLFLGENWEWVGKEEYYMPCPTEEDYPRAVKHDYREFVDSVLEGLDTLFLEEKSELLVQNVIPLSPSMTENMAVHTAPNLDKTVTGERVSEIVSEMIQNENQILLQKEDIQDGGWNFWCGSLVKSASLAKGGADLSTESNHIDKENQCPENESEPRVLSERKGLESVNVYQNSSIKDHNGTNVWSFWSGNMGIESSVCSSLSDSEFLSESENNNSLRNSDQSPPLSSIKSAFGSPLIASDQKSASSIWSRRGKLQSAPQILTSRSEGKKMISEQKKFKPEPLSRALFHEVDGQEEEEDKIFTPDKENFTPNTHRSLRKMAMLKDLQNSSSGKSQMAMMIGSPKVYYENSLSPLSDKENYSPGTLLQQKTSCRASVNQVKSVRLRERREGERMPFQSLLADSPQRSMSEPCFPDAALNKDKCSDKRVRKWSMLVDTTTLLNKEARKALQLLEGLKGTQLIIPKIVIKDLSCLKRQTSFFRRHTEVSSALEWIEDCMVKTQWWIHVQNSMEEGRPVAPTPPASPYSQVSCGTTAGSFIFSSALEYQPEVLSPSVEDHVLDYALSFRSNNNDGQLVLLSSDVTFKIKAMAEGIICETAEAFRESLVNPFSDRFLWADSSPRGQTWACSDDFVLREKFYPSSLKMTPKAMENVKGLKLILLHNSQYFERMTAIH